MTAVSLPAVARVDPRSARRVIALIVAIVAVGMYVAFQGQWVLPHDEAFPLFKSLNGLRDFVDAHRTALDPIRVFIGALVGGFDTLIAGLGWPGVVAVAGGLGVVLGGIRLATLSVLGFATLGVLGLWDASMEIGRASCRERV